MSGASTKARVHHVPDGLAGPSLITEKIDRAGLRLERHSSVLYRTIGNARPVVMNDDEPGPLLVIAKDLAFFPSALPCFPGLERWVYCINGVDLCFPLSMEVIRDFLKID